MKKYEFLEDVALDSRLVKIEGKSYEVYCVFEREVTEFDLDNDLSLLLYCDYRSSCKYTYVLFIPEVLWIYISKEFRGISTDQSDASIFLRRLDEICKDPDLLAFYIMKYEHDQEMEDE